MLEMWLSTEDPARCNWETVCNALQSGQSSAEHQVADDIYNPRSIKVYIFNNTFIELILFNRQ